MLDDDTRAFLEAGSSTIIGILDADGAPFATRAWGSLVLGGDPVRIRVLIGAGVLSTAGYGLGDTAPFAIAMTGADVRTLKSVQVKGTVVAVEPADADDLVRSAAFCDDFFGAVLEIDGIPAEQMARHVPSELWACIAEIAEIYDQTPGPAAGSRMAT